MRYKTASKVREQNQKSKVTWDSSTDSVKRGVEIFRSRILKHIDDMEEKLEPYLCDQNRTDSAEKIYQLIPEVQ
jgi:hypothetical protein